MSVASYYSAAMTMIPLSAPGLSWSYQVCGRNPLSFRRFTSQRIDQYPSSRYYRWILSVYPSSAHRSDWKLKLLYPVSTSLPFSSSRPPNPLIISWARLLGTTLPCSLLYWEETLLTLSLWSFSLSLWFALQAISLSTEVLINQELPLNAQGHPLFALRSWFYRSA